MPNSYVNIGDLAAGATKPVNLQLNISSANSGNLLAAQIAANNGIQGGNFDSSQIHTEQQRHIAILSALDGIYGGYACGGGVPCPLSVVKRGMVLAPGGSYTVYYSGPLGQSSNNSDPLLIAGGLRRHFQTIVGGEDVAHHKPAPDPYLLAARRLKSRTALVVEDSEAGIASGRAAGFEVLPVKHAAEVPELVRRRLSAEST